MVRAQDGVSGPRGYNGEARTRNARRVGLDINDVGWERGIRYRKTPPRRMKDAARLARSGIKTISSRRFAWLLADSQAGVVWWLECREVRDIRVSGRQRGGGRDAIDDGLAVSEECCVERTPQSWSRARSPALKTEQAAARLPGQGKRERERDEDDDDSGRPLPLGRWNEVGRRGWSAGGRRRLWLCVCAMYPVVVGRRAAIDKSPAKAKAECNFHCAPPVNGQAAQQRGAQLPSSCLLCLWGSSLRLSDAALGT